jgi:hypothetical protein
MVWRVLLRRWRRVLLLVVGAWVAAAWLTVRNKRRAKLLDCEAAGEIKSAVTQLLQQLTTQPLAPRAPLEGGDARRVDSVCFAVTTMRAPQPRQRCSLLPPPTHTSRLTALPSRQGGGFRTICYSGQLALLLHRGLLHDETTFFGSSLGALYAAAAALLLPGDVRAEREGVGTLQGFVADCAKYCVDVHIDWLGTWGTCGSRMRSIMERHFPEDVSRANGKCHVCLTQVSPWPRKLLVSQFADKEDLIQAVLASMFIPGWTEGLLRLAAPFRGTVALDGGLLDNYPGPAVTPGCIHWVVCDPLWGGSPLWQVFTLSPYPYPYPYP